MPTTRWKIPWREPLCIGLKVVPIDMSFHKETLGR